MRALWLNLNGRWQFEKDTADTGLERGLVNRDLADTILVPFAPESEMSGVGDVDFLEAVWYRRRIAVPADWPAQRVLLHFQAVDHDATVWVNGVEVGRHRGGFTPFSADITAALDAQRTGWLVVRARDSHLGPQARGKQAVRFANSECYYTRTTGIWQTVWLESVPATRFGRPRLTTDAAGGSIDVTPDIVGAHPGLTVRARAMHGQTAVAEATTSTEAMGRQLRLTIPEDRRRLWSPEDPFLYGLRLEILDADGRLVDALDSYVGLRSLTIEGRRVLLNGRPVFQRLVLDQGYWPDSLMTAPSDEELVADINRAKAAGFNGARVHEKVAEERYLYHADRLGYLIWGEFADWGASGQGPIGDNQRPTSSFITQWTEVLRRDYSHPSIVGWCPLNETHQILHDRITSLDDVTEALFRTTKMFDATRPVIDASGYSHRVRDTDIWDCHDYEQDPETFARHHASLGEGRPYVNRSSDGRDYSLPYQGQPFMVSEFGGIWWNADADAANDGTDRETSWGYGERVRTEDELYRRFEGLVRALDSNPAIFGYCYTQLTDVFQEQNGVYRFDRTPKLDVDRLRTIQEKSAASEHTTGGVRRSTTRDESEVESPQH